jgi:ketosteroid isomerase-like protein
MESGSAKDFLHFTHRNVANREDTAIRAIFEHLISRWNAAASPLAPAALAGLYSKHALFFGGLPAQYVGRVAIEAYFSRYSGSILAMNFSLQEEHLSQSPSGALLMQGFAHFHFDLADQREAQSKLRATLVLDREDAEWKICLHHFSPPPERPPVPVAGSALEEAK